MRAQLIHSSDYRVMPWKNGGGQTTELAIEPRTATLEEGFQWRVSMADVGTDGPFSPFPDYERTLMLLQGKGLDLDFNGHGRKRLETLLDPIQFSGDWSAKSALLDGPCRDFNVITRKGLKHRIAVLRPEPRAVLPEAPTRLLYCVRGKASVSPCGHTLAAQDLLRLDQAGVVEVSAEAPDTLLITVEIGEATGAQANGQA